MALAEWSQTLFGKLLGKSQEQWHPVEVTKPQALSGTKTEFQELTPESIFKKDDLPSLTIQTIIHRSLEPKDFMVRGARLLPIPDSEELVGQAVDNGDGTLKAPYWLNPEVWKETLAEFSAFLHDHGFGPSMRLLVTQHIVENLVGESILVRPVQFVGGEVLKSETTYGINTDAHVTMGGAEGVPVIDLGCLNPQRIKDRELTLIRQEHDHFPKVG